MQLSELWQEVYREVTQFTETLTRLPDECGCQDAEAHQEGRCPCCEGWHARGSPGVHVSCEETLTRLRADFSMLCEDVRRLSAPIEEAAPQEDLRNIRRGVLLAANELLQIGLELDRVGEAVLGFRRSCAASELRRAKRHAAELRAHCDRVDETLTGRTTV